MVDEQTAIQVIDLVLDTYREQPVGLDSERLAVDVQCSNPDAFCPSYRLEYSRD